MEQTQIKKILILIVLAAAVVGVSYLLANKNPAGDKTGETASEQPIVKHTDLSKAQKPAEKIPEGFPSDIPFESLYVTESYKADYGDGMGYLYGFTYQTNSSVADKYTDYKDYMTDRGYQIITDDNQGEAMKVLEGYNDRDTLLVIMSKQEVLTQVQISYTDRK